MHDTDPTGSTPVTCPACGITAVTALAAVRPDGVLACACCDLQLDLASGELRSRGSHRSVTEVRRRGRAVCPDLPASLLHAVQAERPLRFSLTAAQPGLLPALIDPGLVSSITVRLRRAR